MKELRRFFGYLKGYEAQIAVSVMLILAVTALSLPYPMIIKSMVDDALPHKDWDKQKFLMLLFAGVFLTRGALIYVNRVMLQRVGHRVTSDLRKDLFAHLQTLSVKFYDNRHTGKIASRVSEDAGSVFNLVTNVIVTLITDTVTLAAMIGMLFWIHWQLALVAIAVLPLFLVNYSLSKTTLRRLHRIHRRNWDRVVGFLHERVASARLIKSFSMEAREIERFNRGIEEDYRNYNQLTFFNVRLFVVADLISYGGILLVLTYGGWLVIHDQLSIGNLIAFNTYLGFLFAPIVRLNDMNSVVQRAIAALEKIHEVLDTPSFPSESAEAKVLPRVEGRVEFRDVHFSYDGGRKVVHEINLTVDAGQTVALVGPSGAGKTTLINLLCRFYDVDRGGIYIDGHDIRQVTVKSLRQQIGFVMQESLLLSGSIAENIRYGRPDATFEKTVEAAKAANAHDFIMQLPHGYNTVVGERGVKLSGGQKQRIAIARAVLKNPRILIFDEATSSLDTESERLIQDAMERLLQDRTAFIIAHRLSTILSANKIVVMQDGRVVETGAHAELLGARGLYHHLYTLQFRDAA